jgi:hypothetical protein
MSEASKYRSGSGGRPPQGQGCGGTPTAPTTVAPTIAATASRPPPVWVNPFDLNLALGDGTRPSASPSEWPSGRRQDNSYRDVGGGILGSHPPLPVTGMYLPPNPQTCEPQSSHSASSTSHSHKPKMNFPTFDGTNPRLWRDKCESYFEIFGVSDCRCFRPATY